MFKCLAQRPEGQVVYRYTNVINHNIFVTYGCDNRALLSIGIVVCI